ncbi:failed axon connections homolog isoform X2 [Aplysia californica]|nr:failed axon connections homolog isoform X2 [Aplysia californica]XP_005100150.1 failed axon connections homolog isoform X2 [Aplysia californica]XP_005100151.1 failed axon connections homolog isoform X2 [Aplysia californica]XP_005100153.1 failed axon connections homolog isoform X2 [Aplysia californica]
MLSMTTAEDILSSLQESPGKWLVTLGVAVPAFYCLYSRLKTRSPHKSSRTVPPGTVILHQFPRGPFAPSVSPFPVKLETYLRLAKIPYVTETDLNVSSKGKMPWMEFNGEAVADSHQCISHLNRKLGIDLNKGLDPAQRAVARTIQMMCEDHLYWCVAIFRWVLDREKKVIRKAFSQVNSLILWLISRKVREASLAQGMGRHSKEEIKEFLVGDLQALADYLGDKKFMMSDEVTEVDCCVFSFVCQFVYQQKDEDLQGLVEERFPSLYKYCERVKELVWPDWDDICAGRETRLSGN